MTRALPALVFVAVVKCGSAEIIGHVDAGELEEPIIDIAMPDAGPDEAPDAIHEAIDSYTDPGCTALAGGDCNLVAQCTCPAGMYCSFVGGGGSSCDFWEHCSLLSESMALDVGSYCDDWNQCRIGTICYNLSRHSIGYCQEWCLMDEHCSQSGATCSVEPAFDSHDGCIATSIPYKLCTLP